MLEARAQDVFDDPPERKWTPEEDAELMALQRKYGNRWTLIAGRLARWGSIQVRNRHRTLTQIGWNDVMRVALKLPEWDELIIPG
jgi:hypothetical protein